MIGLPQQPNRGEYCFIHKKQEIKMKLITRAKSLVEIIRKTIYEVDAPLPISLVKIERIYNKENENPIVEIESIETTTYKEYLENKFYELEEVLNDLEAMN